MEEKQKRKEQIKFVAYIIVTLMYFVYRFVLFVCITASHRFGLNFVFQMAAYFGYSVAATDIDGDE